MNTQTLPDTGTVDVDSVMMPLSCYTETPEANQKPFRVLLVDDHATARTLLRILIEEHPIFEVVGEAADGEEAITLADIYKPEIVLMDIHLPGLSGVDATRKLHQQWPKTVIVGVSSQYTPHGYNAMIAAGAAAFVCKEDAVGTLLKTIEFSMRGSRSFRPASVAPEHLY